MVIARTMMETKPSDFAGRPALTELCMRRTGITAILPCSGLAA